MNLRISILLIGLFAFACKNDKNPDVAHDTLVDTIAQEKSIVNEKNSEPEKVIETIKVDTDLFTEIILTADHRVNEIEVATFTKMIIKNGDKIVFELYDEDAYDTMELKAIKIKNEIKSRNLLLQKVKDKYFISLFGAQYGCCPRTLTIVQIDNTCINKIFKDALELHEVTYSDKNEINYFGIDSFGESVGVIDSLDVELFTYNPTLVYSLSDSFEFDSLATKEYNEKNYVFAGYDYEGEIRVAFPRDGMERKKGIRKPFIYRK